MPPTWSASSSAPRPDHDRGHQLPRRRAAALSLPIRIDRQPALGHRRSGRGRRAPLRRRCRPRHRRRQRRLRRPAGRRRARHRRACRHSPILRERDVPFGAASARAARRAALRQRRQPARRRALVRPGRGLDDFLVVTVEHASASASSHGGELFRGANGLSPDLGDLVVGGCGDATASRLADIASEHAILDTLCAEPDCRRASAPAPG